MEYSVSVKSVLDVVLGLTSYETFTITCDRGEFERLKRALDIASQRWGEEESRRASYMLDELTEA
jgi:hypothetical protein